MAYLDGFWCYLTVQQSVLLALSTCIFGIWILSRKLVGAGRPLPPSPFQLPLLGCLPFLGSLPHLAFEKWAQKLGRIYSCRLGGKLVVVLNDADLVREAFSKPVFNGRPHMYTTQKTSKGFGISFASDETWPIHRRFAFKTFKALGVGKGQIEEQITEEADRLVADIRQTEGKPFGNKSMLLNAVGNVICAVLFGQRFEGENNRAETDAFYDKMNAVFRFFGAAGVLNIFPVLRIVPQIRNSFTKVIEALEGAAQFIVEVIKHHEECLDSAVIRDYTDAFIREKNKEKLHKGKPVLFTDQQYIGAARELFLTGYDTTTSTLRWAFLYIARNKDAQRKVQQEIDEVVGKARYPCYSDLNKMPYTQATIWEAQRLSSIAPLGIPHRATETTELGGYTIPKDTWIFPNVYHIHRNEKIWPEGDQFKPERFLNATETEVVVPKAFIPFSVGKRQCPGESLAKMGMFLIFSTVLQQFCLDVEGDVSMQPINGITLDTQDYLLRATSR